MLSQLNRLRRKVIVHSIVYYRFNKNLLQDFEYDHLCVQLYEFQLQNPELCGQGVFAEEFVNYSPATGMNFINNEWGVMAAERLLRTTKQGSS